MAVTIENCRRIGTKLKGEIIMKKILFTLLLSAICSIITAQQNNSQKYNSQLLTHAKSGDLKKVQEAIENGADINIIDTDGNTALMRAITYYLEMFDHKEIIKYLVDNRADVNIRNLRGWTALMTASENGLIDIVQLLINNGADPNISMVLGRSNFTAVKLAKYKYNDLKEDYEEDYEEYPGVKKFINNLEKIIEILEEAEAKSLSDIESRLIEGLINPPKKQW